MRQLPYIAFVLVAVLSAACSPHEFPVSESGASERDFSLRIVFDDDLPNHKHITPTTKSEDAAIPRYTILLWRYENESAFGVHPDYTYTFTRSALADLDTTIYLPVIPAKYRVAGWVDWVGGDAGPGYDLTDPEQIALPLEFPAGEHAREAFTFVTDYDVSGMYASGDTYQKAVTMHRPVAQLRIVAPEALTFLAMTGLNPSDMRVTLTYTNPIPDGYNILLGKTNRSRSGVKLSCVPHLDMSGELVFVSDFVFIADSVTDILVDFTVSDVSGRKVIDYSGEVPLLGEHETTVSFETPYGGDDKPGGIGINAGFDGEIEITID